MAVYGQMVLTVQGLALYTKAQTGTQLNFTRLQIGSGELSPGQDPTLLTALITPISYFAINSVSSSGSTAYVKGIFENSGISVATYTCEIGLFAQDPDVGEILYAYANAGTQGDTIPRASSGPLSKQFQINAAIGNASDVTATVPSDSFIPVSQKGAADGVATLDSGGQVPLSQLGNVAATGPATTTTLGTVQAAAAPASGNPIAPIRTAQAKDALITVTTAQQIASFTPTAAGNYVVYLYFRVTSATTNVTITVTYADGTGAQTNTMLNAQASAVGSYSLVPLFINAASGTPIAVSVTASAANRVYASAAIVGV